MFFSQYLKDRKKGKYSMISGKKIKMKVKKSKKDKQVISLFCCHVSKQVCLYSLWMHYLSWLTCCLFCCCCHSGIKIEQNFLSSWTLLCDATVDASGGARARTRQQNSGNNNPAFQENKNEGFSEKDTTCIEGQHQVGCSEVKCLQTTSYIRTPVLYCW